MEGEILKYGPFQARVEDPEPEPKSTELVERAKLFRLVKEENPLFTYDQVAKEATNRVYDQIEDLYTLDTNEYEAKVKEVFIQLYKLHKLSFDWEDVRNSYRRMGWKWNTKQA